ncbi:MAG TPA: hypothetical protein VF657_20245 [Actinoplanes sp.]|jgi:hypothetical protein
MRDAGEVTATAEPDGRTGDDRADPRPPRTTARWWLVAAATVLLTGTGSESLVWAHAHSDVVRRLSAPTALKAFVADDDVIIAAAPTRYSLLARVGGVLRLDGRCLLIDHPAGVRSAIVWPAGTRWSPAERTVVHPSGARIHLGDTFYTAGGYATARHIAGPARLDPASFQRAVACGHQAGGSVVLLGPVPIESK